MAKKTTSSKPGKTKRSNRRELCPECVTRYIDTDHGFCRACLSERLRADPKVNRLLNELRGLTQKAEEDRQRKLALWRSLRDLGLPLADIGQASGIGGNAVLLALQRVEAESA